MLLFFTKRILLLFFSVILTKAAFASNLISDSISLYGRENNSIILNPNIKVSSQFNKENWIYEIRDNLDLKGELLTFPKGSHLVFNGGTIGNGTVDFSNCVNTQIYYSWFSDFGTCNRSLLYMDNKELVFEQDVYINESFTFPRNGFEHQNITLRGGVKTKESRPRIIADGVPCFKIYGHFFRFENLCFQVKSKSKDIACIEIECPMEGLNDVDCEVKNCHFFHSGGGIGIKCKGRGITVEDCVFQTPVFSLSDRRMDISAISLYPDDEPNYPVTGGSQWHDRKSAGRSIIIRNNRLHLSNPGNLLGLYVNPECPEWSFHGVQIVNNLVDAEGSLCVITAKNYGTLIIGNTNYARRASSSMYIANANDMLISNNSLGQLSIGQSLTDNSYDIEFKNYGSICSRQLKGFTSCINSVIVTGNVLSSYGGAVICDSCDMFYNVSISNNVFGEQSFKRNTPRKGILYVSCTSLKDVLICHIVWFFLMTLF